VRTVFDLSTENRQTSRGVVRRTLIIRFVDHVFGNDEQFDTYAHDFRRVNHRISVGTTRIHSNGTRANRELITDNNMLTSPASRPRQSDALMITLRTDDRCRKQYATSGNRTTDIKPV